MKVKDVVDIFENLKNFEEFSKLSDSVGDYINEMALRGKDIVIKSKISEEVFCKLIHAIRTKLVASMAANGFETLLLAELEDGLKPFSDTIILAVIGILEDEEVI